MKDEPQNRPPWLRNLRPRQELEAAVQEPATTLEEPRKGAGGTEATLEASPDIRRSATRQYALLLVFLLWMNVAVLGCLFLLATQRVVP